EAGSVGVPCCGWRCPCRPARGLPGRVFASCTCQRSGSVDGTAIGDRAGPGHREVSIITLMPTKRPGGRKCHTWPRELISYGGEEVARVTAGGIDGEVGFVEAVEAFFVARAPRKDAPHTRAAYRRDRYRVGDLVGRWVGVPARRLRCGA